MRLYLFFLLILFQTYLQAQVIEGKLLDSKTKLPLEYVSIGVIDTPYGTLSDKQGHFSLKINKLDSGTVRISLIGYKSQIFAVSDLINKNNEILLKEEILDLPEVVIKTHYKKRKIGAKRAKMFSGWSGWGGKHNRKGYEIGVALDLGADYVELVDLNVLLKRQSFDKSVYRLHIRRMQDSHVAEELLIENIILSISNESGWAKLNLEPYGIILKGKIGITLEWVDVMGNHQDRIQKINGKKQKFYILFKNNNNYKGLYRWGVEAKWKIQDNSCPSMYVTVKS
jgi:hypothetical protein